MNGTRKAAGIVLAALALGAAIIYVRSDREETRLWRAFDRVLRAVEKRGAESVLESAQRARETAEAFAPEVRVALPPFGEGTLSRNELAARIFHVRSLPDTLEFHTQKRALEIAPDRRTARMRMEASAVARSGSAVEREFRVAILEWERADREWRIAAVTAEEGIRRLPPPP